MKINLPFDPVTGTIPRRVPRDPTDRSQSQEQEQTSAYRGPSQSQTQVPSHSFSQSQHPLPSFADFSSTKLSEQLHKLFEDQNKKIEAVMQYQLETRNMMMESIKLQQKAYTDLKDTMHVVMLKQEATQARLDEASNIMRDTRREVREAQQDIGDVHVLLLSYLNPNATEEELRSHRQGSRESPVHSSSPAKQAQENIIINMEDQQVQQQEPNEQVQSQETPHSPAQREDLRVTTEYPGKVSVEKETPLQTEEEVASHIVSEVLLQLHTEMESAIQTSPPEVSAPSPSSLPHPTLAHVAPIPPHPMDTPPDPSPLPLIIHPDYPLTTEQPISPSDE